MLDQPPVVRQLGQISTQLGEPLLSEHITNPISVIQMQMSLGAKYVLRNAEILNRPIFFLAASN